MVRSRRTARIRQFADCPAREPAGSGCPKASSIHRSGRIGLAESSALSSPRRFLGKRHLPNVVHVKILKCVDERGLASIVAGNKVDGTGQVEFSVNVNCPLLMATRRRTPCLMPLPPFRPVGVVFQAQFGGLATRLRLGASASEVSLFPVLVRVFEGRIDKSVHGGRKRKNGRRRAWNTIPRLFSGPNTWERSVSGVIPRLAIILHAVELCRSAGVFRCQRHDSSGSAPNLAGCPGACVPPGPGKSTSRKKVIA